MHPTGGRIRILTVEASTKLDVHKWVTYNFFKRPWPIDIFSLPVVQFDAN